MFHYATQMSFNVFPRAICYLIMLSFSRSLHAYLKILFKIGLIIIFIMFCKKYVIDNSPIKIYIYIFKTLSLKSF